MNSTFKVGDLVKILYLPMSGDFGIVIEQGTDPVDGTGLNINVTECLVRLTDGRKVWFRTEELINV